MGGALLRFFLRVVAYFQGTLEGFITLVAGLIKGSAAFTSETNHYTFKAYRRVLFGF